MDKHTFDFIERTFKHIRRVQDNAVYLLKNHADTLYLSEGSQLTILKNIAKHDLSKWSDEQFEPYINTFNRKIKDPKFADAWKHHYTNENHHYEDGSIFTKEEQIEVICDLQAMADEFGEGSCRKFFLEKWIPRYLAWGNENKGTTLSNYIADDYFHHSMVSFMLIVIDCFELRK